jgi:hypothetical protein
VRTPDLAQFIHKISSRFPSRNQQLLIQNWGGGRTTLLLPRYNQFTKRRKIAAKSSQEVRLSIVSLEGFGGYFVKDDRQLEETRCIRCSPACLVSICSLCGIICPGSKQQKLAKHSQRASAREFARRSNSRIATGLCTTLPHGSGVSGGLSLGNLFSLLLCFFCCFAFLLPLFLFSIFDGAVV